MADTKRIDLEVRSIGWKGVMEAVEFRACNSFGQDFLEDELSLKGTGARTNTLTVSNQLTAQGIVERACREGLQVVVLGWGN